MAIQIPMEIITSPSVETGKIIGGTFLAVLLIFLSGHFHLAESLEVLAKSLFKRTEIDSANIEDIDEDCTNMTIKRIYGWVPSEATVIILLLLEVCLVILIIDRYAKAFQTNQVDVNDSGRFLWDSEDGHFKLFPNQLNPRPVIGVLAQEKTKSKIWGPAGGQFNSTDDSLGYVGEAYVKWLQASGALVMPIPLCTSKDDLLDLMQNHLSGLVLPGSNTGLVKKPLFQGMISAAIDFTITKQTNIPIFGICMGHQSIYLSLKAAETNYTGRGHYYRLVNISNALKRNLKLKIVEPQARIMEGITDTMVMTLAEDRVVLHNHKWGMTRKMVNSVKGLVTVAVTENDEGLEFVSVLEHQDLPFFGTQWHPEKPPFTFGRKKGGAYNFMHSRVAIEVSQFFGNSFVDICRKHPNRFLKKDGVLSYSLVPFLVEQAEKTMVYLV